MEGLDTFASCVIPVLNPYRKGLCATQAVRKEFCLDGAVAKRLNLEQLAGEGAQPVNFQRNKEETTRLMPC
jgi:hypothetical protein